ncbi:MAG: glycosyltransferase family 4 protein [Verrucomicrobia bacterium]|nr:glycosyltransferase family 4 protein [Verrucomicrobiota bacterium]
MGENRIVLMILSHVGSGGDWIAADSLAGELSKRGCTLHLGANYARSSVDRKFAFSEKLPLNEGLHGLVRSLGCIGQFDPRTAVIHTHSTSALLFGIALKLFRCRRASIIHSFHLHLLDPPLAHFGKSLLYRFPNRLHCSSRDLAAYAETYYGIPRPKIVLLPLGADDERFWPPTAAERAQYRRNLGLDPATFTLLFAGRLNPEKNVDLLLSALARDGGTPGKVHLLVAGTGPLEPHLREQVKELGLSERVTFLGHVKELCPVYGAADLLVLPSKARETFGLVVIEAALCELPCLRSDTFGARDQIEDGVDGEIFRHGDETDLRRRLLRLMLDPEKVRRMGQAAYKKAKAQFTLNALGERFDGLIENLVNAKRVGAVE